MVHTADEQTPSSRIFMVQISDSFVFMANTKVERQRLPHIKQCSIVIYVLLLKLAFYTFRLRRRMLTIKMIQQIWSCALVH